MESRSTRAATPCYLSTPEHSNTFYGKYSYIYTDKGSLEVINGKLRFEGRLTSLEVPLGSITELQLGRFNRAAKPLGLNRIELTYSTTGTGLSRTVYLVPTLSGFMPTWKTNDIVADWHEWLSSQKLGS